MTCSSVFGQVNQYQYKRELIGITDQWHNLVLTNEILEKSSQNLSDLRIYGYTKQGDTIESPYLLRLLKPKTISKKIDFKRLNRSHNANGYFYTYEIPSQEPINQIKLDFSKDNFDWQVTVEGSQDQQVWFTVVEEERILSIKNNQTSFQYTTINFPSANYRFFRVLIKSKEKPELNSANITQIETIQGTSRNYTIKEYKTIENRKLKRTEIDVEFQSHVRLSCLKINVSNDFDYYRPVVIKYVSDSSKTEQGWRYRYTTLARGILSSVKENTLQFSSTPVKKLKIEIENYDNQPLAIGSVEAKGYVHELVARFSEQAQYFLCYGNNRVHKPSYDIARFSKNIPKTTVALTLGEEQIIEKEEIQAKEPLFKNKWWLWAIMIVIIALLGWFSIKMLGKE